MKTATVLICILLLAAGCVSSDYVGKTYPPTTSVDIFMTESDVTRPFETMGEMSVESDDVFFVNAEKLQNKLLEEAKKKGADAVILSGLERRATGEETTTTSETKVKDDRVKTTGKVESTVKEKKTLRGRLIKYKTAGSQ
jgi:hypothetical protein